MPVQTAPIPHYKQVHGDADAILLEDLWWNGWEKKTSYILPCWFRAEEQHIIEQDISSERQVGLNAHRQ